MRHESQCLGVFVWFLDSVCLHFLPYNCQLIVCSFFHHSTSVCSSFLGEHFLVFSSALFSRLKFQVDCDAYHCSLVYVLFLEKNCSHNLVRVHILVMRHATFVMQISSCPKPLYMSCIWLSLPLRGVEWWNDCWVTPNLLSRSRIQMSEPMGLVIVAPTAVSSYLWCCPYDHVVYENYLWQKSLHADLWETGPLYWLFLWLPATTLCLSSFPENHLITCFTSTTARSQCNMWVFDIKQMCVRYRFGLRKRKVIEVCKFLRYANYRGTKIVIPIVISKSLCWYFGSSDCDCVRWHAEL